MQETVAIPTVYISYAWNSESSTIAASIEKEFNKRGLRTIRDKTDLKYKGIIKDFMKDIGRGKYVILIISNKYLRSENCMYELLQIFKNQNFQERIFPIVLDEVKIAKATDRLDLMKYWENEVDNLDSKVRELKKIANIQGVTDDINLYTEIRSNIAKLTNILKNINTLNTNQHISSDFEQLYGLVQTQIKNDLKIKNGGGKTVKKFKQGVLAVAGLLVIVLIVQFTKDKPLSITEPDRVKKSEVTTKDRDSSPTLEVKDILASQKNEVTKKKILSSNTLFDVTIFVPSHMAKEDMYVDHKLAKVVNRSLNSITVRLRKKKSSHHFEIRKGSQRCITDKLIEKDSIQFALLCD